MSEPATLQKDQAAEPPLTEEQRQQLGDEIFQDITEQKCPEDCAMCSGEACELCGAGCWSNVTDCQHDVIERHTIESAVPTSTQEPQRFALSGRCDNGNHSDCPYPDKCKCSCHAGASAQAGVEAGQIIRKKAQAMRHRMMGGYLVYTEDELVTSLTELVAAVRAATLTPTEPTIEQCLSELRETWPDNEFTFDFAFRPDGWKQVSIFRFAPPTNFRDTIVVAQGASLAEAMAAAREFKAKEKENGRS